MSRVYYITDSYLYIYYAEPSDAQTERNLGKNHGSLYCPHRYIAAGIVVNLLWTKKRVQQIY